MAEVTLTNAVKELRVSIDGDIRYAEALAKEINRGPGGREMALAITKLQEAKMWAGQVLGAIGHTLPEEYRDEAKQKELLISIAHEREIGPSGVCWVCGKQGDDMGKFITSPTGPIHLIHQTKECVDGAYQKEAKEKGIK